MNPYKSNIWKFYLFRFLEDFAIFSGVIIPFFTIWGGITFAQVMILQAIFTFAIFLFEIPTGTIADKFGRKTSLSIGAFMTGVGALVYISFPNFWVFAFAEIIWAAGSTMISGANHALVYDSLKETKEEKSSKKIFTRISMIGLIGMMISAPIGSLIAKEFGLHYPMLLTSIPFILGGFVALTFKEPQIHKKEEKPRYFETLKEGINYFKKHKVLKILTFDYVSIMVLSFFVVWIYQVVLTSLNVSIALFGFIHASIILSEIIVLSFLLKLEKIFGGKRKYLLFTSLIVGISFIAMALTMNVYISIFAMLLIAGLGITRKDLYVSYFNKFIESHNRATVLSTIAMILAITTAIANVILGYFVDWNLKYSLLGIGVLAIVFALISKVKEGHLID